MLLEMAFIGRERHQLIGRSFLAELKGDESLSAFRFGVQAMTSGQFIEWESSLNTGAWFLLSASKLQDYLVLTLKDFSQQKAILADIAARQEDLDHFFIMALDLFTVANTDGLLLKINKAWEHCLELLC